MNIFYLPEIKGEIVLLDEIESGHAIRVLRMKKGDNVTLTDGSGGWYEGLIEEAHPKKCLIRITSRQMVFEKRDYRLVLAVAPTKNSDRTEWLMEKAVEIGIDKFIPVLCRFSERKNINRMRLHKVAMAAMKQSLKAYMPEISELFSFTEVVRSPFNGKKFIAHCYPGEKPHLRELISAGDDVLVLIGPEGDFSEDEVTLALQNGFREISLGKSRLRTETAALAACHTVALVNT